MNCLRFALTMYYKITFNDIIKYIVFYIFQIAIGKNEDRWHRQREKRRQWE